jgi:hypothetical protein
MTLIGSFAQKTLYCLVFPQSSEKTPCTDRRPKSHREDDDAIAALIQRSNPDSPKYPFPQTDEDFAAMEEIFRQKLNSYGTAA